MNKNDVLTDPKKLVTLELKNAGFDIDNIETPKRVYLLADDIYNLMISKNVGKYKYPLGGKLYVLNNNENIGFIKGNMCSPGIATQAEDLIAGGVKELVHIGYAGGLQTDMSIGDIVITNGAYNDTAVAKLYGFDYDFIESSEKLTNKLSKLLENNSIKFIKGCHWTTDAGYRETWEQVLYYRTKGALCVEMEGVGLFTIAKYRNCTSTGIYIISDIPIESGWKLGWGKDIINKSVENIINIIINSETE